MHIINKDMSDTNKEYVRHEYIMLERDNTNKERRNDNGFKIQGR